MHKWWQWSKHIEVDSDGLTGQALSSTTLSLANVTETIQVIRFILIYVHQQRERPFMNIAENQHMVNIGTRSQVQ